MNIDHVLVFEQRNWIKSYIDFNIQQRQKATMDFAKGFWKLMNNSVFGKFMENLLNRVDIKLAQTEKKSRKLLASPRLKDFKIFNNDLVAFNLRKKYVYLNRPFYVDATILEISKNILTSFYYNYIKRKYADNVRLLFIDTDSLTLLVHTRDFYEDMRSKLKTHFDTSDYPPDHFLHDQTNKKVLGKFKDELQDVPILEFVGLRSKCYSILTEIEEKKQPRACHNRERERELGL
uniref:DNA-directed DNA polymerase n=1 Tax=Strigamia maritima TaxID=126957 RepID=T1IQ61_STRMM